MDDATDLPSILVEMKLDPIIEYPGIELNSTLEGVIDNTAHLGSYDDNEEIPQDTTDTVIAPSHSQINSYQGHSHNNDYTDAEYRQISNEPQNQLKITEPQIGERYSTVVNDLKYNMSHPRRGRAIIINIENFDEKLPVETRRYGTSVDADNLLQTFGKLGFEAYRYDDLYVFEIDDLLQKVASEDHSNCDCVVVAILSHGSQDVVYGRDGPVEIDQMTKYFKGDVCPTLAGKPKLFFIQACRGQQVDSGISTQTYDEIDCGHPHPQRIPIEADFLMCYATVQGFISWRNEEYGSAFVQALCQMLDLYANGMDLLRIMTRVNYIVANEYEFTISTLSNEFGRIEKKKQMPSIVSMLTKELYFSSKP
ncbi:caspase-3-like [Ptychodera flava]|uniref:caspase-3-like n=1 Tax=Ptychodera flava TaxID=63121 RepID=UPI00396A60EE